MSAPGRTASDLLARHAAAVEAALQRWLIDLPPDAPPRLTDAIRYSLLGGGKRLRPALVLECFTACSTHARAGDGEASALAAAGAIELIHAFSLVHDDLPAMDDDDLRRGRPTTHRAFDEALAILAGDAMTTLAFEMLAVHAAPRHVAALVRELAGASGPGGMIGGQALDIASEGASLDLPQLQRVHRLKTGALLTCACRMGAIAADADAPRFERLGRFGVHLGLAFQIVDDILDETSTPEQLGKATGKDRSRGKNTYPALLGLDASRARAAAELAAALTCLDPSDRGLAEMARFVVDRSH